MNFDVLLLVVGAALALATAAAVAVWSPGRFASLLAAGGLGALAMVELGFARAVHELFESGNVFWFRYALALAFPVSMLWLLLSVTLGRGEGGRGLGGWRFFLGFEALLACVLAFVVLRAPDVPLPAGSARIVALGRAEGTLLAATILNVVLLAAKMEATYGSLSPRNREVFRPLLAGVLGGAGVAIYFGLSAVVAGHVSADDVSLTAPPATIVSLLLALSFIRGRIGEARVWNDGPPVTGTNSLFLATGVVLGTAALLWVSRTLGLSLGRALAMTAIAGIVFGVAALTVSNRLRRRLEGLLDPIWHEPRAARRLALERGEGPLVNARSIEELCRLIPGDARTIADLDPVTLFLADEATGAYRPVASTLEPEPKVAVLENEPLALELRRARRAIRLVGRPDDLEYVGIYVENGAQIEACGAVCAAPLRGRSGMFGFLLCGGPSGQGGVRGESLVVLGLISREYSALMDRLSAPRGSSGGESN